MKKILIILALISTPAMAELQIHHSTGLHNPMVEAGWVRGYTRQDGTYVQPYYRGPADGQCWNNKAGCN